MPALYGAPTTGQSRWRPNLSPVAGKLDAMANMTTQLADQLDWHWACETFTSIT
jgi:hypothetical protein